MFEGYDRAFVVQVAVRASAVATVITEGGRPKDDGDRLDGALRDEPDVPAAEIDMLLEMPKGKAEEVSVTRAGSMARARLAKERPMAKMDVAAASVPPPQAMALQAPAPRKSAGLFSALGGLADALSSSEQGGGGGASSTLDGRAEESPIEPANAWLDFDTLALKPVDDRAHRGRLLRETDARTADARRDARAHIDQTASPQGALDPLSSRGMFDHRYDAEGVAEIPSDGQTHRVSLGTGETTPTLRWRTVPREGAEVYREAELRNPFDAPLLAGPVDVYLDGSLLAVASVDRIDRGGTMHVGMGLEQRLRVARNVRVREETAGLLGGDTIVRHEVSIELSSARAEGALVEVLDRLPVTEDKTVDIVLERSAPEQERYTQAERGAPVRGGMAWRVIVPAGGRASVEYAYRVTIPSKNEMVGGNRRD